MSNSRNGQGGEEDRAGKRGKSDEAVDKERERAVDAAMAQIEKQHGKGAIMRLGGDGALAGVEAQQSSWQGRWEEGWRRFHSEEPALSITAFEAALAAGAPDPTTAHLVIAFAHAKLEQWREGVEAMTAGLATAPTDADWSAPTTRSFAL